jgi:hypothetical protein
VVISESDFDVSFIKINKRVNCLAHQIELIVGSIFAADVRGNSAINKALEIISKMRKKKKVVRYLREHCGGKSLLSLSETRWGGLSAKLDRFLLVHKRLFEVSDLNGFVLLL